MSEHPQIIIRKKKSHGGHAHHGGSWKVAYADFVTAMMAFFMVMWIMGLSDSDKAQIQGYFNDPLGFMKNPPSSRTVISFKDTVPRPGDGTSDTPHEREKSDAQTDGKKLAEAIAGVKGLHDLQENVEISLTHEGLQIEFRESAKIGFFESGSAILRPEAKKLIAHIAPNFAKSRSPICIAGHTDAKPYSSTAYNNWDLSVARAAALRRELQADGVPPHQFKRIEGLADTQLRFPSRPYDPGNRRVTILLPFEHHAGDEAEMPTSGMRRSVRGVSPGGVGIALRSPDVIGNNR